MQVHQVGLITYYRFSSFDNLGIVHAIFTRHGGASPHPWNSLNFGASVGDDLARVMLNRENALAVLNIKPDDVYDVYQVHSTEIVYADKPLAVGEPHIKADAMITNTPNINLLMRFADCVPILLIDPKKRIIGIAHAGWKGTVNKIAAKTVTKMVQDFRTNPTDVLAAIGPSIGPDHYLVGEDVINKVAINFGNASEELIIRDNGKSYFDLWKANQIVLTEVGVNKIEIAGICTQCNLGDWYSHRGEHGKTGRFGVVFGLS